MVRQRWLATVLTQTRNKITKEPGKARERKGELTDIDDAASHPLLSREPVLMRSTPVTTESYSRSKTTAPPPQPGRRYCMTATSSTWRFLHPDIHAAPSTNTTG